MSLCQYTTFHIPIQDRTAHIFNAFFAFSYLRTLRALRETLFGKAT